MSLQAPNVLLLITDQQSRYAQSAAGNPWASTPHLDALAARGVRFERAYCAAPVCGPSRSSLDTGQPPHRTGVLFNGRPRRPYLQETSGLFAAAGYEVAWAGARAGDRPSPTLTDGGCVELLLPRGARGLAIDTDPLVRQAAVDFLRRPHRRPFLLTVCLLNPHDICYWVMGRAASVADTGAEPPPLPPDFDLLALEPDFVGRCRTRPHYGEENTFTAAWDERRWRCYLREYHALTSRVDAEVGCILGALAAAGLEDDTVVLHTADHGEGMAHHRWVVKLMLWESVVGVPLTVAGPGLPAGEVRAHLASGMDVLPTLCDLSGVPVPDGLQGQSLGPVLRDPGAAGRDAVVVELQPDPEDPCLGARAVVTATHKYVAFSEGQPAQCLFDLRVDRAEGHDLSRDADHAEVLDQHREHLRRWIAATGDPFVPPR